MVMRPTKLQIYEVEPLVGSHCYHLRSYESAKRLLDAHCVIRSSLIKLSVVTLRQAPEMPPAEPVKVHHQHRAHKSSDTGNRNEEEYDEFMEYSEEEEESQANVEPSYGK